MVISGLQIGHFGFNLPKIKCALTIKQLTFWFNFAFSLHILSCTAGVSQSMWGNDLLGGAVCRMSAPGCSSGVHRERDIYNRFQATSSSYLTTLGSGTCLENFCWLVLKMNRISLDKSALKAIDEYLEYRRFVFMLEGYCLVSFVFPLQVFIADFIFSLLWQQYSIQRAR